ncbi:MAG TPA: TetR/AcrR family transcriptional regulator [Pseudonocardiaceae bacterium]|nr:TetR/AcrR family transcriptional regulator [Pseudonocardiaceae bacterium]
MGDVDDRRLTPKGRATRERIVKTAAELIVQHGVAGTSIDDVRQATGVSGSQMTHYFTDKRSLVRVVIAWQADAVVALHQLPVLGELDSFEALDMWCELNIARQRRASCQGGCGFGSLAGELAEDETRTDLARGFERWEALFRHGLRLMKQRGELRPDADIDELAMGLLAALQGGLLLTRTRRDIRPVEAALRTMVAHVRSFATDEAARADTGRKPAVRRKAARLVAAL